MKKVMSFYFESLTHSSYSLYVCSLRIIINPLVNYLTQKTSHLFQTCFHFFNRPSVDLNGPYVLCSLMLLYSSVPLVPLYGCRGFLSFF
jgi:hypothetical protein